MTVKYDTIVCGAGITGLSLATKWRSLTGDRVLVVTEDIGGMIGSFGERGYTFDFGGHVYTRGHPELSELLSSSDVVEHDRMAKYLHNDGVVLDYPVQDHAAEMGIKLEGEPQTYRGQSLEEFVVGTFGQDFYRKWYTKFNERVWTAHPRHMDCDWIHGRIKIEREPAKAWGPNAQFYYAPGEKIIQTLVRRAREAGVEFRRNSILKMDVEQRLLTVTEAIGTRRYTADRIFWTLPLPSLLHQVGISGERFISNRVRSIGVGLKRTTSPKFHWLYCNIASPVHRITQLSRYHWSMAPQGCDSYLFEVPWRGLEYPLPSFVEGHFPGSAHLDFREAHYRTGYDVMRMSGLFELDPTIKQSDIATVMMGECIGYPIPILGVRKDVAAAKSRLSAHNVFTAGRWGSWAYFNLDHNLEDVNECIDWAYNPIDSHDYLWSPHYYKVYRK